MSATIILDIFLQTIRHLCENRVRGPLLPAGGRSKKFSIATRPRKIIICILNMDSISFFLSAIIIDIVLQTIRHLCENRVRGPPLPAAGSRSKKSSIATALSQINIYILKMNSIRIFFVCDQY